MMALFARLGLGGIGLKGLASLFVTASALIIAAWLAATLYKAGIHAERIRTLEAIIAQIRADLIANEIVTRQAEADARAAEAEERKLRELIDALQNDKSCPLAREHVDGLRRIDEGP